MSGLLKRVKTNALFSAALYALLGAITLILGGILAFDPFEAFTTVVRFIGAFLVYDGLSDLWISVQVGKAVRQAEKDANAMRNAIDIDIEYRDISKQTKRAAQPLFLFAYLDLRRTSNMKAQTRCTEATLMRSLGVWISRSSGPMDTQSRPGSLADSRPHSKPAWMAST